MAAILKNESNVFMPHSEGRQTVVTNLASNNADLVLNTNGDSNAIITIRTAVAASLTYSIEGSEDGSNFLPLLAYPYSPGLIVALSPVIPILSEAITIAVTRRLCVSCGQLRKIRVRISSYSSGSIDCQITSDTQSSIHQFLNFSGAPSHIVTATGAVSSAVTATLPAPPAGLRHYINNVTIVRSATAALTASATPVVVTSTNLPGPIAWTFGADAGGIGVDKGVSSDFSLIGLAASSSGVATTIVAPAYTGVIWRTIVSYRFGI
jgi:hypothetical protein